MKPLAATFAALLCVASASAADDIPNAEVFGGFSVLSVEAQRGFGWQASVAGNLNRNISLLADLGGHYKFHVSSYEYLFGPQFNARGERTTAFAHVLFGGARLLGFDSAMNGFAMGIGGGLDVNATSRIALRVFQVDWIPSRFEGGWQNKTGRIGFGVVFKSGS